jgi:hypothetical protein
VQAYYILDELFIGGELQETSKKEVLKVCAEQDELLDVVTPPPPLPTTAQQRCGRHSPAPFPPDPHS